MPEADVKSNLKQATAQKPTPGNYLSQRFSSVDLASVPDVAGFYHHEFRQRVDEVAGHSSSVLGSASVAFKKMFTTKKPEVSGAAARKSGADVARYQETASNRQLVDSLAAAPDKHAARMALVKNVMQDSSIPLDGARKLLMQCALPLGMGFYHPENIKMLVNVHRRYLTKLVEKYREDTQRILEKMESGAEPDPRHKQVLEKLRTNEGLVTRFLERQDKSEGEAEHLRSFTRKSLTKAVLDQLEVPQGSSLKAEKAKLERMAMSTVLLLVNVEFLQPEMLNLVDVLRKVNPNSPVPDFLEGRLWMNDLKRWVIMHEVTAKAKNQVQERLKKCLESYGRSLKVVSNQEPADIHKNIYLGHATVCLFAYSLKSLLGIPPSVLAKFLTTGKKSLERSGLQMRLDRTGLYQRYVEAFGDQRLDWDAPAA